MYRCDEWAIQNSAISATTEPRFISTTEQIISTLQHGIQILLYTTGHLDFDSFHFLSDSFALNSSVI